MRLRQSDAPLRLFKTALNALALAALATLGPAQAAEWPNRPITVVNLFAAGGLTDVSARAVARALTERLGQSAVVETRSGAGGTVGTVYVANAPADGYTLLTTATGPAVLNQLLSKNPHYNTERDFTPVVLIGEVPQVIVCDPKLGFKSLQDLIEFGRKNPGKLSIGHSGIGSTGHLTATLFLARTGIQATLVSYRGGVPLLMDVLSGHIQAGVPTYSPQAQQVTMLAVTSEQRISFLPNVPTAREGGVELIASTWAALLAPAKTPRDVVLKINKAANEFLATDEAKQLFTQAGIRPLGGTPEQLAEVIKKESAQWAPIVTKENIKLDPN